MSNREHRCAEVVEAEKALLKTFNRQCLLSNNDAGWTDIRFLLTHSSSASTLPEEIFFQGDVIHIWTDMPSEYVAQTRIDGRFQKSSLVAGHSLILPLGTAYWISENQKNTAITLGFNPGFLARSVSERFSSTCLELHPQFPTFDPLIHQIGLALKAELKRNPQGSRIYAESAATFLATHLLHHYASRKHAPYDYQGGLPKHKLQPVIDYIYANLDRNLGLSDLAELVQMSPYHFSRLFKQSTGHSPYQFVIKCRVQRAKELLLNSDLSIAQITYTVGFANQSHLTNHFKRMLGVTPKMVRQK
jgi:AraC family transcriptional regulator